MTYPSDYSQLTVKIRSKKKRMGRKNDPNVKVTSDARWRADALWAPVPFARPFERSFSWAPSRRYALCFHLINYPDRFRVSSVRGDANIGIDALVIETSSSYRRLYVYQGMCD